MTGDRWRRVQELFLEALAERPERRAALVHDLDRREPELAAEVRSLVEAYAAEGGFDPVGLAEDTAVAPPRVGEMLGPYRLIRRIGSGGGGVVYLAEQKEPFARRVAVKLLSHGAVSSAGWRRFRSERQILAGIEHPNVARLLDGGTSPGGFPFFVMEYVEGLPIDRFCDRHRLSVEQRLKIFERACSAVHACHQRLVVHRDLKPGNILVTRDHQPKLLDFGIAKLLAPERSPLAVEATAPGLRPLTPSYASPEQLRGEPLTTVSDIYALGVLLYQLLSGRLPSDEPGYLAERLRPEGAPEPPRPPSRAVAEPAADGPSADEISRARSSRPGQLRRSLEGDLDAIVLTALRTEPGRRYPSAERLADDLRRHRSRRPVTARPETLAYRTGKLLRRHRAASAVTAVALGLLLVFVAALMAQVRETGQERDRVTRERDRARQVTQFLVSLFESADPAQGGASKLTVRGLLHRASGRALAELGGQPETRAVALEAIGDVYRNLGLYGEARSALEEALAIRRRLHGPAAPESSGTLIRLGELHAERGELDTAEILLERAVELRRRSLGPGHPEVAEALSAIADLRRLRGELSEAEDLQRRALAIQRRTLPGDAVELAASLHNLAAIYAEQGDPAAAERLERQALALWSRRLPAEHPRLADGFNDLAVHLYRQGRNGEAEALYREALTVRTRAFGAEHPKVAETLHNLAGVLARQGELAGAEASVRESLAIHRRALGGEHRKVAMNLSLLAGLLEARGALDEAEECRRRALEIGRRVLPPDHPGLAHPLESLGRLLLARGERGEGCAALGEAAGLRRRGLPPGSPLTGRVEEVLEVCRGAGSPDGPAQTPSRG